MQDPDPKCRHFGSNKLCIKEGVHFVYMVYGSLWWHFILMMTKVEDDDLDNSEELLPCHWILNGPKC